jgi:hypothetical protein
LLEERRKTYAAALAAVHTYQKLPSRIRRRPDSEPKTLGELGAVISDVQRDLDFYKSLLDLDSPELGAAYDALVQASRNQGKKHREQAWQQPPAMTYPETYRPKVKAQQDLCLARMRQHLRLIHLRRDRT